VVDFVFIGKAPFDKLRAGYFSFHSTSYGNKNSYSPIDSMLSVIGDERVFKPHQWLDRIWGVI